jgi:hypothetical protein
MVTYGQKVGRSRAAAPTLLPLHRLVGVVLLVAAVLVVAAGGVAVTRQQPDRWVVAACVCLAAAGWLLQFSVRVGSSRLIFAWGTTAMAVALVLEPPYWVVLTTFAGMALATLAPPGRTVIKACYNTALYTAGAAAAAALYAAIGPPDLRATLWPGLAEVVVSALAYVAVVDVGVQAVLSVVQQRRFVSSYWHDIRGRVVHLIAELVLVMAAAAAAAVAPRLLLAVPVVALCLHQGHRGAVAAEFERRSAERIYRALQALTAEHDEVMVARRGAEQINVLLGAHATEILLHSSDDPPRPAVLIRCGPAARLLISAPAAAPPLGSHITVLEPIGEDATAELRVYFAASDVRLTARETSAVRTLTRIRE